MYHKQASRPAGDLGRNPTLLEPFVVPVASQSDKNLRIFDSKEKALLELIWHDPKDLENLVTI